MLVDSHAHLDFPEFNKDLDQVLKRAKKAGVGKIINIGADIDLSKNAIDIAEKNESVWATVGIHAEYADDHNLTNLKDKIEQLVESSRKVVAIGECGPDYNWNDNNHQKQLELFKLQIELAIDLDLPLVVHIRNKENEEAAQDAYNLLKEAGVQKGVVHCFTLNKEWAEKLLDLGFYLGFTGIITYKNADNIREVLKTVPLDKILIETDAPFLAPQGHRGKRNEPAFIVEVAERIGETKNINAEEVENITSQNAKTLFDI